MEWRFWRWKRRDREIEEEIAHDLLLETEENIGSGMPRREAEMASRRDFGNVLRAQEETREVWVWRSLEILAQDLRYAARMLRQSPGFAATAILTLALGVGANTAIFTVFDEMAFRPLPVKDGERIVAIYESFHGRFDRNMHGNIHMLSYGEFVNYRARNQVFTEMAAYAEVRRLTLGSTPPEAVAGLLATEDYFRVLSAGTALGRTFTAEEAATPHAVAVLSNGYWQRRFGSDREIVGKTIRLNQTVFTIVGVAAAGLVGTSTTPPDVWLPLAMQKQIMTDLPAGEPQDFLAADKLGWLSAVGKLKRGITARQAQADLQFLASQMDQNYPGRITEVSAIPGTFLINPDARPAVLIGGSLVMAAVGLVLFAACANIANLLLARAAARQREIAVRLSLGATRGRLVRQLLTESTVIAVLGSALGLVLAERLLELGRAAIGVTNVDLSPDRNILAYTLLLSIAASLMFGLIPALQATAPNLAEAARARKGRVQSRLIAVQVAICSVLLIGAGLLVRGLVNLTRADPGFQVKNVYLTSLDLGPPNYDDARAAAFYGELLRRIDAEPGVRSALTAAVPLRSVRMVGVEVDADGQQAAGGREANSNVVSSNYFEAMGIRIERGRTFSETEAARGDAVAVVSGAMERAYWPGQSALGKRFRYGSKGRMQTAEAIGVAADVRSIHLASPDGPLFYLPARPGAGLIVATRTNGARPMAGAILRAVHQIDPTVLAAVRTMEDNLERETSPTRLAAGLALLLGGLALALAAVGIYGVTAYVVSQRTQEIGIRMALGAERPGILRWIVAKSMRPVAVGAAAGVPLAAAGSVAASRLLLGVHPLDPIAFIGVSAFVGLVAAVASYLPARGAMRVDPVVTLRHEGGGWG